MTEPLTFLAAFGAGVVSFIAPCTLALVPGYIAFLGGFTFAGAGGPTVSVPGARVSTFANTLLFALGFTTVFVGLGASLGALSQTLIAYQAWLNRIGGVLLIALGLMTMGLLKIAFLEKGFGVNFAAVRKLRFVGAFVVGAAFAVGWTPCVGPVLAGVFVLAGASGSVTQGALLLTAYSAGLMLPFLAAGLTTSWTSWLLRRQGRWLELATQLSGALLVLLGIALFTGVLGRLSGYLALGT